MRLTGNGVILRCMTYSCIINTSITMHINHALLIVRTNYEVINQQTLKHHVM
jgi:hypothetical protein